MNYITDYIYHQNVVFFRKLSEHRELLIQPSRFEWNKFKNHLHFYFMLGAIPCGLGILYANVFIGPATLSEIPEGYTPKHWEYSRVKLFINYLDFSFTFNYFLSILLPVLLQSTYCLLPNKSMKSIWLLCLLNMKKQNYGKILSVY